MRARYEQVKTEIRAGRYFPSARRRALLFDELLEDYRAAAERKGKAIMRTDVGYRRLLERFGGRQASSITGAEVEELQSDLLENRAPPPSTIIYNSCARSCCAQ